MEIFFNFTIKTLHSLWVVSNSPKYLFNHSLQLFICLLAVCDMFYKVVVGGGTLAGLC